MKTCLTIAGSDSSGGAGIQADLKTFAAHNVYGMSAITAVTAQNTKGVLAIQVLEPALVAQQFNAVLSDIPPDTIKIGMLANRDIIDVIAQQLATSTCSNRVLDPVMVSTSGTQLLDESAIEHLIHTLLPEISLITPNSLELKILCDAVGINTPDLLQKDDLATFTQALSESLRAISHQHNVAILSKGGHIDSKQAEDYLLIDGAEHWFSCDKSANTNTHGTGCTLSSAITAQLALGHTLVDSVQGAKHYLTRAINHNLDLGSGCGPLNHNIT